MDILSALKIAKGIHDSKDSNLGKTILIIALFPVVFLLIMLAAIIYLLTSTLSAVFSLFTDVEMPDIIKDFKSDNAYITYQYATESWGELSPPTYNNKIVNSEYTEEHTGITFKGSTMMWKRYAYSIDDGIITGMTEDSITIFHQANDKIDHAYYSYFSNVKYTDDFDLEIGSSVHKGKRIILAGSGELYFELRDEEGTAFDPNPYINFDSVENAPDKELEEETSIDTDREEDE